MQKKKKRMYDGGKSVLHVKNSAGGFYKVKKTVHMAHPNGRVCGAKRPKCEAERSHHL